MTIFFNFSPTSTHPHPLQVENCDVSNPRLVVDEDNNGKFRLERVKALKYLCINLPGMTGPPTDKLGYHEIRTNILSAYEN